MEYRGWVKLHRKLIDSAIFGNEKGLKIWLWCLLKASHKDHDLLIGRQKLLIHKGQFIMGSERAVDELKLAKATIWYWLNFLEKEGQVRLQKTTKYTVVTLLNWTEYQEDLDTNETPKERQVGTYKNEEKVKNVSPAAKAEEPIEEVTDIKDPKNTPEMLAFYTIFSHNPARFTFKGRVHEREATKVLLQEYGYDECKRRYRISQKHKSDPNCPQIDSPADMLEKMVKMETYLKNI